MSHRAPGHGLLDSSFDSGAGGGAVGLVLDQVLVAAAGHDLYRAAQPPDAGDLVEAHRAGLGQA